MKTQEDWYNEYPDLKKNNVALPNDDFYLTKITQEAGMLLPFIPIDKPCIGIEVGVNRAETSCILLHRRPLLKLYLVDCWEYYPDLKNVALHHLSFFNKDRYKLIHKKSKNAITDVQEKVDFCFLDAHKGEEDYIHDILEWYKKVKNGGYLFGHDIHNYNITNINSVEKLVRKCGKILNNNDIWINDYRYSWFIKKQEN